MSPSPLKISVVVVNYNVRPLLAECLDSLREAVARGEAVQVVVVDCASQDRSPELVRDRFPDFELLEVQNRGYGAGANAGIAACRGNAILVLNADTIVHQGAISFLARALLLDSNVGLVGPRLIYPDGRRQPSKRRFPGRWTPAFESTIIEEWLPTNKWVTSYRMTGSSPGDSQDVDWLVGAALMARTRMIEDVGGFDERFWMYGEELEWCYRIRRHGWRIRYLDCAVITHHEGASTSQDTLRSRLEFDRGRLRAQRRLYGVASTRIVAMLLRLNYGLQLAREAAKWMIGHKRELRAARVAHYWTLVRSDLNVD